MDRRTVPAILLVALLVALLGGLLGGLLRASAGPVAPAPLVAYIGDRSLAEDAAFARFAEVLGQRLDPARRRYRLIHVAAPYGDEAGHRAAIDSALARHCTVIVAPTSESAAAARRHARGTPVVFATYMDPVASGLADSALTSGWAATGVSLADPVDAKRLELLRDAFPTARDVGMLVDDAYVSDLPAPTLVSQAAALGLRLHLVVANERGQLERALADAARFDAWYVPATYPDYMWHADIVAALRRARRPAIFSIAEHVRRGGMLGYEQDASFAWTAMADLVARVAFDGEAPGSIPIERPRRYLLWVRSSDEAAGLAVAPALVRRADKVF